MAEENKEAVPSKEKEAPAKKKGGGMKRIIMIAVLVLALAGVGYGGMILGKKQAAKTVAAKPKDTASEVAGDAKGGDATAKPKEDAAASSETPKEGAPKEGGEGGGEGGAAPSGDGTDPGLTFDMSKLTVNLADPSGRHYVQISLQLQGASAKAREEIEANKAPLIDATLTLISTKTREDMQPPAGRERLKRELIARYDGLITPKSVSNIYITQMVFQ